MTELENREEAWKFLLSDIERRIISGDLKPGQKLPSIRVLRTEYMVSVWTVQKALEHLSKDENIVKKPGKGYFICPQITDRLLKKHKDNLRRIVSDACQDAIKIGIDPCELLPPNMKIGKN